MDIPWHAVDNFHVLKHADTNAWVSVRAVYNTNIKGCTSVVTTKSTNHQQLMISRKDEFVDWKTVCLCTEQKSFAFVYIF